MPRWAVKNFGLKTGHEFHQAGWNKPVFEAATMVEAPTTSGPKVGLLLLDTAEASEAPWDGNDETYWNLAWEWFFG